MLAAILIVSFAFVMLPFAAGKQHAFLYGTALFLIYSVPLAAGLWLHVAKLGKKGLAFLQSLLVIPPVSLFMLLMDEYAVQTAIRDFALASYVSGSVERIVAGLVLWAVMFADCIMMLICSIKR